MTIGDEKAMAAVMAIPRKLDEAARQLGRIADALEKMSGDYVKIDWSNINGVDTASGKPVVRKVVYDPVSGKVVSIEEED